MPFTERSSNISGRDSRASNFSAASRPGQANATSTPSDTLSTAPGVLSMLKTGTDTGDIGALSFNNARWPNLPRPVHQRRSNARRLSESSHSFTASQATSRRGSNPPGWDPTGHTLGPRGSLTSLQTMPSYVPDTMSPTLVSIPRTSPYGPQPTYAKDGRSYSLTSQPSYGLANHQSLTSLRSHGTGPGSQQRSAFAYPTRLKRPGYRPSSPALSDFSGGAPPPRRMPRPMMPAYNSDYGADYHVAPRRFESGAHLRAPRSHHDYAVDYYNEPRRLHVGPSMRASSNSPVMHQDSHHFAYRPGPMRSAPALPIPRPLPTRVGTPQTAPSSSNPPSSAPPSSDPPTPRDGPPVQTVDTAVIDSAVHDLTEDGSELTIPPHYYDYTEHLDKLAEVELEPQSPAIPMGFVQRIKTILEEKAASEEVAKAESVMFHTAPSSSLPMVDAVEVQNQEPVELPASPVKIIAELPADPAHHITRAMITAAVSPSSSAQPSTSVDDTTTQNFSIQVEVTQTNASIDTTNTGETAEFMEQSSPESSVKQSGTLSESTTTVSLPGSPASGTDYALRFSVPPPPQPEQLPELRVEDMLKRNNHCPVSPLRPGEENNRFSAISPMVTETLNITVAADETPMPGAFPDDTAAPGTPGRSQSMSSPATQAPEPVVRFSLPPDLSQLNESTITSEMGVPDVAVRFSVPHTAVAAKPHLITTTPDPTQSPRPVEAVHTAPSPVELPTIRSPRASVDYEDLAAPLQIRKANTIRESFNSEHSLTGPRRSFPRRAGSVFDDQPDQKRFSRDSTTDLRFSGLRFPGNHLPGLKEESQEDMTATDLRAMGYRLPLPRPGIAQGLQERTRHSHDVSRSSRPSSRLPNMTLAELRDLPSLNFSRMDLFDKLNDALEVRSTRSVDIIHRGAYAGICCPTPERPASTELIRERYTSFFDKNVELDLPDEEAQPVGEYVPVEDSDVKNKPEADDEGDKEDKASAESGKRPLSPEEFLTVVTEVNRLSVPSVTGLTERLSELFPTLRRLHLDGVITDDAAVEHTIDEIHQLGHRPDTILSVRSSGGLRQLAAHADMIATNGTRDSTMKPQSRLMKELPPLPEASDSVSAVESSKRQSIYSRNTVSPVVELEAPLPAALRAKSPSGSVFGALSLESIVIPPRVSSRNSAQRPLIISSPGSRPWNKDENYPWSGSNVALDITLPQKAHLRDSVASREKSQGSGDAVSDGDMTDRSRALQQRSAGSPTSDLEHTASVSTELLAGHSRGRSLFGSLSRKIGLTAHISNPDNNATSGIPSDSLLPPPSADERSAVDPGDRYPTTGLTPPSAFNLAEVRSFFSDDSSEHERDGSGIFRKRLTHFKTKLPPPIVSRTHSPRSFDVRLHRDGEGEEGDGLGYRGRFGAHSAAGGQAGGMSRVEFRVKRVAERERKDDVEVGHNQTLRPSELALRSLVCGPRGLSDDGPPEHLSPVQRGHVVPGDEVVAVD
ncbi:hypothetical protein LTR66_009979 [Elasticomyces elasticus]|nr:hypothetical protein LTR66_009979 [Elasticomyces elasticus]